MMFGISEGTENYKLKWSNIQLLEDQTSREYLKFIYRTRDKNQKRWNYSPWGIPTETVLNSR